MKGRFPLLPLAMLCSTVGLTGCASLKDQVVLKPVGPEVVDTPQSQANGTLLVFSALDPAAHFDSLRDRDFFTDYRIAREDGAPVQNVENDNGTSLGGPRPVSLPAGAYRVLARANGYRQVTVPVVIVANQVTTVHLDGTRPTEGGGATQERQVKLPDGQVVGWLAK